jgi:hypothetical protein
VRVRNDSQSQSGRIVGEPFRIPFLEPVMHLFLEDFGILGAWKRAENLTRVM